MRVRACDDERCDASVCVARADVRSECVDGWAKKGVGNSLFSDREQVQMIRRMDVERLIQAMAALAYKAFFGDAMDAYQV